MKRHYWTALFFVPSMAFSLEVVNLPKAPLNLPSTPVVLPTMPTLPSKPIPGPFEGGKPFIRLPDVVVPRLPFPVRMAPMTTVRPVTQLPSVMPAMPKTLSAAAQSDKGIQAANLDAAYDNVREDEDGRTVVVVDPKKALKKKRQQPRHMLPESELELEIGIIQ